MTAIKIVLTTIVALGAWLGFVLVTAFYGWWMSPIAPPGDSGEFFAEAVQLAESGNRGNLALVLIEEGDVIGEYYSTSHDPVNADTVFSTASMSKWLAASAVMKLVEDGQLDLDAPVSNYLSRWQLPASEFDHDEVTTRRLLSHTAGLADGLGYGDYTADEALPALETSLASPRASDDRRAQIKVTMQPGAEFKYSGGGYLILQLLIEEVAGVPFEQYLDATFFKPLQMTRSGYGYIAEIDNNAGSYDRNGEPAPLYRYASSAATGFVTSASDLTKFVRSLVIVRGRDDNLVRVLNEHTLAAMRQAHGRTSGFDVWGLGVILYAPTASGAAVFGHDGANEPAINSSARINPDSGDAFIALETGHPSLATAIGSQWVLWQTGYPDVLDSNSVIESMYLPLIIGAFLIIVAAVGLGIRRTR